MTRYVKGACFIATAAYGTELENEINILRYWRDRFLLKSYLGEMFIKSYYIVSPPIANYVYKKKFLKYLTRTLLNPIINILKIIYKK